MTSSAVPSANAASLTRAYHRLSSLKNNNFARRHGSIGYRLTLNLEALKHSKYAMSQYIVKFKKDASTEDIEKFYEAIAKQGAEIKGKKHTSKILPHATVAFPSSFSSNVDSLKDQYDCVDYTEADGEMKTQ